ncbi:MAG: hypothetical protein OEY49_19055, partial [Candidatus Heimdallarchaeota archaeon]|nr:hypothetical protein [Candidatus Heimdallarchaeota archaeon]
FINYLYAEDQTYPTKENYIPAYIQQHDIIMEKQNRIIGQCSVFLNSKTKEAMIGHFEIEALDVGVEIIADAEKYISSKGYDFILATINGSRLGFSKLFYSGEKPTYIEPANPIFYNDAFVKSGFQLYQQYYSYRTVDINKIIQYTKPSYEQAIQDMFTFKTLKSLSFNKFREFIVEIINQSFEFENLQIDNLTVNIYKQVYKSLKYIINPELSMVAFDKFNIPVSFILIIDDWSKYIRGKRNITNNIKFIFMKRFRLIKPRDPIMRTMATIPKYQKHNLSWAIIYIIHNKLNEMGIASMEYQLANKNYVSHHMAMKFCQIIREFRLYSKNLE